MNTRAHLPIQVLWLGQSLHAQKVWKLRHLACQYFCSEMSSSFYVQVSKHITIYVIYKAALNRWSMVIYSYKSIYILISMIIKVITLYIVIKV